MKWSLFNWKKPAVSSGEPEDYQVVKNTVNQNTTNIRTLNTQLTNTVSTNTAQTITGAKTFNANVVISNNPTPLILKSTNNDKNYVVFRDSANNSNLSIGANATSSAIEVNRGDLEIQTQQPNKAISINTGRVKFNRSAVEFGTDINAGYGGATVKFIPEDNSTKTLQFYNQNPGDQRRFKLAVPEPVDNNNPATKNYVDRKETALNNQITAINNRIVENNTILRRKYTFTPTNATPTAIGNFYIYHFLVSDLQNSIILSVSSNFGNVNGSSQQAANWQTTWGVYGDSQLKIKLAVDKTFYDNTNSNFPGLLNIDFSAFSVEIFYMLSPTNRESETIYTGRILTLEEAMGVNNEN